MHQRKCSKCNTRCKYSSLSRDPIPGVFIRQNGMPDVCYPCGGTGFIKVYTKEEKSQIEAAKKERYDALCSVKARAKEIGWYPYQDSVRDGFEKLATEEPERLPKLYASLRAGRIDDVVRALDAYGK